MAGRQMQVDVAIVGGGPSGLFAAFEVGFLGYKAVVVEAQAQTGGQLAALYPDKPVFDVPGCPGILAGVLATQLRAQADMFATEYLLERHVTVLEGEAGAFVLHTAEGDEIRCKVVIIAGGGGMFVPRKPTQVADLEAFEQSGSVAYAVTHKAALAGQTVVLAGGGDSAVDWVVALAEVAAHVHVVHRRMDFRAAEGTVAQMRALAAAGKVTIHTPYELVALRGPEGRLETVEIGGEGLEPRVLAAQRLVCCFGLLPTPGPLAAWGVGLERGVIPVDRVTQQTARAGVLCIGDMAGYEGKVSLMVTGFGEAAVAAKTVQAIVDPAKKWKVQYSTSKLG